MDKLPELLKLLLDCSRILRFSFMSNISELILLLRSRLGKIPILDIDVEGAQKLRSAGFPVGLEALLSH